ncbi:hypothetical protein [uncultured Acinetobacter sp.]|uniref:hypothetical protein n=1 Tax=uncultured Acinetobacter sp. TaxID=165433 RepID=UPI002601AD17|nr:hypothetical protein [uncultured Acinetobacter sp.]
MRLSRIAFGLAAAQMTAAAENLGATLRAMQITTQAGNAKQNRVSQKKRRLKARQTGNYK